MIITMQLSIDRSVSKDQDHERQEVRFDFPTRNVTLKGLWSLRDYNILYIRDFDTGLHLSSLVWKGGYTTVVISDDS